MYSSLRYYSIDPDTYADVGKTFMQGFVNQLCRSPGFRAYCLSDGGDGVIFTLSVFETQAQVEESNTMARLWVEKALKDKVLEPPRITLGRVGLARTYAGIKRKHLRYFDNETFS